jgi:hypothetical protein
VTGRDGEDERVGELTELVEFLGVGDAGVVDVGE